MAFHTLIKMSPQLLSCGFHLSPILELNPPNSTVSLAIGLRLADRCQALIDIGAPSQNQDSKQDELEPRPQSRGLALLAPISRS